MDHYFLVFGPLVWPLAMLAIALIFRKDVGVALGRVGQVKYRDLELTFREDLHQAEQLARSIPSLPAAKSSMVLEVAEDEAKPLVGRLIVSPSPAAEESPPAPKAPVKLDLHRPREAIEAAWLDLARLLDRSTKFKASPASTSPTVDALVGLLRTLRDRSSRLELPPPTPEDARRYVELANGVASRINELG